MSSIISKRFVIRPIQKNDNQQIAIIIKTVLSEFGFSEESSAEDNMLDDLFSYYNNKKQNGAYFVISDEQNNIYGGGGFSMLKNSPPEDAICEIQKFYFSAQIRHQHYGKELLSLVLQQAVNYGYKTAYLETATRLPASIKLYKAFGFKECEPMRDTDHQCACDIHMQLVLVEK